MSVHKNARTTPLGRAVMVRRIEVEGIVEADETLVLASGKGARKLDRKPRKRGSIARKRGISKEQVPILVAADRSGTTVSAVLPDTTATTIRTIVETLIEPDALLVTDDVPFFAPRSSRPVPEPWASATNRSTARPANAAAASFT